MRDLFDDDKLERELVYAWWSGSDVQARVCRCQYASEIIEQLGKPMFGGLTQGEIAQMIDASEGALSEAKKRGSISFEKLVRLEKLATIRGIKCPSPPEFSATIQDNISEMISAMKYLQEQSHEFTGTALDATVYRCVQSALHCEEWQVACYEGNVGVEREKAEQLLRDVGVYDRDQTWLRSVYVEWYPVLEVVLESIDAIFRRKGLRGHHE